MIIKSGLSLTANLFVIADPFFQLYLINGENPAIIDTGVAHSANKFLHNITQLLGEKPLKKILLTHSHWDHTGGLSAISEKYKPSTFASRACAELLKKPQVISFINRMNREYAGTKFIPDHFFLTSIFSLNEIYQDYKIELDHNLTIKVYETPGHTRCSVSYVLEQQAILFPGDALGIIEKDGTIRPLFLSDYSDYINSIRLLSELSLEFIALPHNLYIKKETSVKKFLKKTLDSTLSFLDLIHRHLKTREEEQIIAKKILASHFSNSTIEGPQEAFIINLVAMIRAAKRVLNL